MKVKRIFAIAMVLMVMLSTVACKNESTTKTDPTKATGSEANDTSSEANATSAPTATTDDPLSDPSGVLTPDKDTTLSVWLMTAEQAPAPDNKITKLLKEKLGVTLQYEIVTPDNADQKIGVMLAGGEYPDLVGTTDLKMRLLEGGALIKLDDLLATGNYPNIKTHVDPYIKKMSYGGSEVDPGLYIIPNYNRFYGNITGGTHWGTAFWIQKAVLADAGYPDLTNITLEQYFKLIEDYKAKYPEINGQKTVGFEVLASTGREWGMTNPPNFLAGNPNNGGVIVDSNNNATIYADKPIAHDFFKILNAEYAKGVVDPESFTENFDQYTAKIATGVVLGMHDQYWNFQTATQALQGAGMDERTYAPVMPVYPGAEPYYADRDVMNTNQGFGVSVSSKQPEAALKFVDLMLSEPWQKVLSWGIEGEDYEVDDNGMFYRTEQQRINYKDLTWRSSNRLTALLDLLPKHNGQFTDGNAYSPDDQPTEFYETLSDYDKAFMKAYDKKTWREFVNSPPDNPVYYPCWNITLSDEATEVNQQLTDANVQYLPKAITGSVDDFESNWTKYVDTIKKIDVKVYEDAINQGIQERIENWK
jgi:putative aldouronate transport system substrate-binding protein